MKHLTTLITTLLLSIIASPMSADTGGTYQLVTDPNDFEEGDIIILASYTSDGTIVTMGEYNNDPKYPGEFTSCELSNSPIATISNNIATMPSLLVISEVNTSSTPKEIIVSRINKNEEPTKLTLKNSNNTNTYLFYNVDKSNISFTDNDHTFWTYMSDNSYSAGLLIKSYTHNRYIGYNTSYEIFKAYILGNNIKPTVCYKKVIPPATVPYTISSYGYSTLYYSNKSLILPEGLKAYTYTIEDGNLKVLETFNGSSENESNRIVPKGAAVMVKGAPGEYELVETTTEAYNNSNNVLAGTDTESETTGGSKYYMLSVGKIGLGFYWGADDGGAFTNGEHKAYLRIPAGSSAKALHFSLPDDDIPTAIAISSATKPTLTTPSYNLQGINASTTHSGIVISNGKKLIRK